MIELFHVLLQNIKKISLKEFLFIYSGLNAILNLRKNIGGMQMSFDGIVTRAVINELETSIVGGKITKIYQQEKDEILIHIHNLGKNYRLILSASSNNPRIYLTNYSKKNPDTPPVFCMLLRKHLTNGIITEINQYELDRIVMIDIKCLDEMGEINTKQLIIEIMGKHSNIILVDKFSRTIVDSIKRVPYDMSRVRQVLPGLKYEFPPSNDKVNPIDINFDTFIKIYDKENKNTQIFKFLYTNFIGLSPLISREICYRAHIDERKSMEYLDINEKELLFKSLKELMEDIKFKNFSPNIIFHSERNEIIDFHSMNISQYSDMNIEHNESMSFILDKYYLEKDILDRISQKSLSIKKSIQVKLDRSINKLAKQKEELLEAKKREKYKIYGDLISANIYKISKGMNNIQLENFYSENMEEISVPLDVKLSPSENAQYYYKKYAKLKNASKLLESQIPQTQEEIDYLENILISIENCTEIEELEEIKDELINEGYIKNSYKNKKKSNNKISKPHHFLSSDNFHIYVGKNNKQNDYLTLKFADKEDLWFHTKNIPGSHVIIKTEHKKVPDTTLYEAALLAAFYSKGRNSQNVPVDYTYKKNVKKPKGSKPGMVIYENNNTIYVSPSKQEIFTIKKVED